MGHFDADDIASKVRSARAANEKASAAADEKESAYRAALQLHLPLLDEYADDARAVLRRLGVEPRPAGELANYRAWFVGPAVWFLPSTRLLLKRTGPFFILSAGRYQDAQRISTLAKHLHKTGLHNIELRLQDGGWTWSHHHSIDGDQVGTEWPPLTECISRDIETLGKSR